MSIEEIKKKFIIDDDALKTRLGPIATKALQHCVLDAKGNVHFNDPKLTPRQKLRLTLAARAIGAQMDAKIQALTPAQINEAFRRHLDPAQLSIVKAGDFRKANVYRK